MRKDLIATEDRCSVILLYISSANLVVFVWILDWDAKEAGPDVFW